ncbi:MAG: hypothetical protein A3E02_00835 [Candidatus Zambryskibacteria bacterium RIFCSPHIGHO2_12_FULL_38_34]|uniref:Glycosyl transferase family 1 domain-containing protein n=1 Tax=Candidatus Zambryskibacteria bacterium RIFCSPLOWO2_12_FULL_39_16 TaxID=1802775 RepID=A0A1G2UQV0_9BACT|nr:MAG: hypothetical protein A3D37_01400 [Candidatus Zambryskibacteria bacterium RIFCSPHIGHO2_02_FULL_38_22]OHA97342.1 MAG: hypothetical protein A3E02_00835 [Candidatus Zambryskibacteria bacterium RIFCSPHIGHO2_12_FULL_38_34]OHB08214.1 MAG: hypothetical protein A3I19_01810 [Candidatus Zambryskibacteria bacterium RIFCSPLOWO2_02_FULL_38_13]OHB11756.1 MAG: hypothetical protein A3G46_01430 [Candidatus Zambryskibacteria bacterium RIFCSPLOWO2_12_FULL_39_16]
MYCPIFPPAIGGPSTQAFNLCKALVAKGKTPFVITYGKNFSMKEDDGFKVYTFRLQYTYTPIDKVLRWFIFPFYIVYMLKKERSEILHCHSVSVLTFISAFVAKIMGIPRVLKFAGDWVWETLSTNKLQAKNFEEIYKKSLTARFMTWIEKMGLNLFDKIWVVSEFRRGNIKSLLGSDDKVIIINNCLLLKGGGARTWKKDDPVIVVSANRFIPHKRLAFMVQLFAEMNISNSHLTLIGGGDPKEIEIVKEAIKKFKVEDKIEILGILPIEEVYERFSKASFYISTSIEEGFPNVFIEAMHYGLPVIATDEGGSKELVLDKETGYMFVPANHQRVLEAMRRLATDIPLRTQMSTKAFERSKLFNLEYKVGEFITMYNNLLSE